MSMPEFIEFPVSLVKTEPETIIKNEPSDDSINLSNEETLLDIKNIDTVSHMKQEDSINSETVPITQVFVKTENDPFIEMENITHSEIIIKTEEDTSDGNGLVEVQGKLIVNLKFMFFYISKIYGPLISSNVFILFLRASAIIAIFMFVKVFLF